jgi:flagella basal body P-ring formation protein FlgA
MKRGRAMSVLLLCVIACGRASASEYQSIAAASYLSVARVALSGSLANREPNVQIELAGTYQDLRVPVGHVDLQARAPGAPSRSRAVVWIDVFVAGRLCASRPVSFALHSWNRVLVAKERLAARTVLDKGQFELRQADTALLTGAAITDVKSLAGKRLRRALPAGAVVSLRDLQDVPTVQKGDKLAVYARVGHVVVKSAAVAQRDAFTGDVIDARVPASGERLHVRVTGSNTAWISENETTRVF